jgi:hypothetical protein
MANNDIQLPITSSGTRAPPPCLKEAINVTGRKETPEGLEQLLVG